MQEFEEHLDSGDLAAGYRWLSETFPDHKAVVQVEHCRLSREHTQLLPSIERQLRAETGGR